MTGPTRPGSRTRSGRSRLFLDLVDEAAPGLVEGLYLHGSLGFGEWHEGRSDVDVWRSAGRWSARGAAAARPDRLAADVMAFTGLVIESGLGLRP